MEEESFVKKQKKKMLVPPNESPKRMEKSSDDNVKIPTITSDEDVADKQNKLKPKNPKETSRRSGRRGKPPKAKKETAVSTYGKVKEPATSMYGKVKEQSKRGGKNRSKKKQRQKPKANDVVIRAMYSKVNNRLQKGKAQSNARNQEGLVCPDEISKQIDVPEEYDTEMMKEKTFFDPEVSAVSGLFPMNNENNGRLFIRGVPFWCLKDERPPVVNCVGMSSTLKDLIDKKFILLKELPEPNNLDPFHEMNTMTSRDEEYFKDKNRLLSNTVRSMVAANELKKTSEMRPPNVSTRNNVLGFQAPTNIHIYNRKNRSETMATVPITSNVNALAKKEKKKGGILANFFA